MLDDYLDEHRILGVRTIFQHGVPTYLIPIESTEVNRLTLEVRVFPNVGADVERMKANILNIVREHCYLLGGVFDPVEIQNEIQNLDSVNLSTIRKPTNKISLKWVGYFEPPTSTSFIKIANTAGEVGDSS